ncbi:hypothetical protein [Asticcacaulis sp. YBE204]|uniref:hypothetical protein n=1 Tax=Asticcacaulis sp. YBE204 TaxID=1282363 RepID=UPI0003C3FFF4|nr:hypothetical protein [Asticcacaulis sp. YBE204]ESQ78285.1 hypothetical protein AEYBE204_14030 [Asticcacaulis sp. YBE204]
MIFGPNSGRRSIKRTLIIFLPFMLFAGVQVLAATYPNNFGNLLLISHDEIAFAKDFFVIGAILQGCSWLALSLFKPLP